MTIRHLNIFVAVADYGSMSAAATHLYLSNFFFITASFHDILKETAVITYGKTKKIYYQAQ